MISLGECKKLAESGVPCQMLTPDGKWVEFDESYVITKFRRAPRLFGNSGTRVLMYALHRLEEMVEAHFRDRDSWIDLPAVGAKKDWTVTCGTQGLLGGEVPRFRPSPNDPYTMDSGLTLKNGVDMSGVRLRDIFKTYFRILKNGNNGYLVEMRDLKYAVNSWLTVFSVEKNYFVPNDNFSLARDKAGIEWSWSIDCNRLFSQFSIPKAWEAKLTKHMDVSSPFSSDHRKQPVTVQQIHTVSRINPSGTEVLSNIALFVCNYLTIISKTDMNLKNFKDFIETNMAKSDDPTHQVSKPNWVPDNRSLVIFRQYEEFEKYRADALGKKKYDAEGVFDRYQTKAILLRYFNDKYHGTIYEVRDQNGN